MCAWKRHVEIIKNRLILLYFFAKCWTVSEYRGRYSEPNLHSFPSVEMILNWTWTACKSLMLGLGKARAPESAAPSLKQQPLLLPSESLRYSKSHCFAVTGQHSAVMAVEPVVCVVDHLMISHGLIIWSVTGSYILIMPFQGLWQWLNQLWWHLPVAPSSIG